jgi:hypothetical protein
MMMEAFAATIIGLIAPYLAKGAEEFAKAVGKEAFDQCKRLTDRLQRWWQGNPVASVTVDNFAKDPQNYGGVLGHLLATDLAKDPQLATELQQIVDSMGPNVEVVQKIDIGKGVTGAEIGELVAGSVNVRQEIRDAQSVIGFKANKVGGGSSPD